MSTKMEYFILPIGITLLLTLFTFILLKAAKKKRPHVDKVIRPLSGMELDFATMHNVGNCIVSCAYFIESKIKMDPNKLEKIINWMMERHPALRMCIRKHSSSNDYYF